MKSKILFGALASFLVLLGISCRAGATEVPLPPEWVTSPPAPVFLNPKSQHVDPGSEFSISAEVMPGKWGVSAGELKLSFDPKALEVMSIKPGDLLGAKPLVGIERVDRDRGVITYALARVGKTTSPGVRGIFATIRFKARDTAKGKLSIGVIGAGLSNEKFEEIPGLKAQGATVTIIEQKSSQR